MPSLVNKLGWLRSGLLWRTFFLLAVLLAISMATWVASFSWVEREPRAKQVAAQVVSIVTLTRAALTHSAPELRRELLFDLASNEGVRIYPREPNDRVRAPEATPIMSDIQSSVRAKLGKETAFAAVVNEIPGFWVSFDLEGDEYWLALERERVERVSSAQWLGWGAVSLLLSLLGAVFISRLINQPLARLSAATRAVAVGQRPQPLPEQGPTEIREANRSFNQMVDDLARVESDRAVILAGISHDLRTPISRMVLEVEMAELPQEARVGMQSDLAQMDAIIGQFLDYARPAGREQMTALDLSALVEEIGNDARRQADLLVNIEIEPRLLVLGDDTELRRVLSNLIENARRYGKGDDGRTHLDLRCHREGEAVLLEVADHGPGVPESELPQLLRPFTRLDAARSQANGAGLGLAIVDRILQRHQAVLTLGRTDGGGLKVQARFPALA